MCRLWCGSNKMLSYRSETALQGALVLAKRGRLELGDNILHTSTTVT